MAKYGVGPIVWTANYGAHHMITIDLISYCDQCNETQRKKQKK